MICPSCEYQYLDGLTRCPDCDEKLIPSEQFEGNLTHPTDYIVAYTTNVMYEAEMLKANLESAGIDTKILSQKDSSIPTPGDLSVIKILVPIKEAEDAILIIKDINERKTEDSEEGS